MNLFFLFQVELHERARKHGLHCVQSEDTLTWTDSGCNQADVLDNYIICECAGINNYYTVNGQLNPRKKTICIITKTLHSIKTNHIR